MVTGRADLVRAMHKNIYMTHAKNAETGPHGLGQVAKEPMLNNADYFDFLSKDAYFDGSYKIVRKADRVINRQNASLTIAAYSKSTELYAA